LPRFRLVLVLLALAGVAVTIGHTARAAGNALRGEKIAERWCAACHIVGPGLVRLSKDFPASFQEISDTPGMGELALKVFFQTPHKQMPNFSIAGGVRDDLIAYITGLKSK
jgi:mono/diheme cytochrome c family protein